MTKSNPLKASKPLELETDRRVPRVVFFVPNVGDLVLAGVTEEGPLVVDVTVELRNALVVLGNIVAATLQGSSS